MDVQRIRDRGDLPTQCIVAAREYLCLEVKVKTTLSRSFGTSCRKCLGLCCRSGICCESLNSAWLSIIWSLCGYQKSEYNAEAGWMTSDGCKLDAGRPPVCYAFVCDELYEGVSRGSHFSCLNTVSNLLTLSGTNALGTRHLITLTTEEICFRLNHARLRKRIAKSLETYEQCERLLSSEKSKRISPR
jgi:hypothetical protein